MLVKIKKDTIRNPMLLIDCPNKPMEKIALDMIEPYRKSPSNNQYVLTIQCQLAKFLILVPLENITATVADALINKFISIFGSPKMMLTDLGINFTKDLFKQIAKRFKIKKIYTSAHRPMSNGNIERANANIHEFLRHYSNEYDE